MDNTYARVAGYLQPATVESHRESRASIRPRKGVRTLGPFQVP